MLMPSIFGEDLFDEMFGVPAREYYQKPAHQAARTDLMRTDIREDGDHYILDVDLPGYKKEDIKLHLKEGYLTIEASRTDNKDEKDNNGKYIRRERYMGHCSRSFFVGKNLTHEDVHAKYDNGILKLTFPKEDKKQVEEKKYIAIEG